MVGDVVGSFVDCTVGLSDGTEVGSCVVPGSRVGDVVGDMVGA